jgi:hypothetical protein
VRIGLVNWLESLTKQTAHDWNAMEIAGIRYLHLLKVMERKDSTTCSLLIEKQK